MQVRRKRSESGSAMVELTLMSPWLFFLFVGIFAFGFYMYTGISVQNAARVAAAQTSSGPASANQVNACQAVLAEMNLVPRDKSFDPTCSSGVLVVTQKTLCGAQAPQSVICSLDGGVTQVKAPTNPTCADCVQDPTAASSQVTVAYQSVKLVPIPGLLMGQFNLTRIEEMRIVVQ